jgi:glutathione S-transferase
LADEGRMLHRQTRVLDQLASSIMNSAPDKIHYVRIPDALGARAEVLRMTYALADRPYVDVLYPLPEARNAVSGKNPFKQFPFVETPTGEIIYQTIAMMHHAAHGTPAWPSDPERLTKALAVAMGGYDLYQAFVGFLSGGDVGQKMFEERWAPKFLSAFGEIYAERAFAAGEAPSFADCMVRESVAWVVRRNAIAKGLYEHNAALVAFQTRFGAVPAIRAFLDRQAAARAVDNAV